MIIMAKRKGSSGSGEAQYVVTQANLDKKGKTNKKLKRNTMAAKYLTAKGKELKEAGEKAHKENFKKGRRYRTAEAPVES
jgi:hypothetical protein